MPYRSISFAFLLVLLSACRLSYTTTSTSTSSSSSSGAPPPTPVSCVPANCFFLCITQGSNGTSSLPSLSPSCSLYEALKAGVELSQPVTAWVQSVGAQDCAPGDNNKQFLVPQGLACGDGCPADPDKLPPSCLAVCDGTPTPALVGCPMNNATVSFIADLEGVTCDPGGGYSEIHPDPSLVNTGTCLRVLPGPGAGGGGSGGAGPGGAGGGGEGAGDAGGAGGA
jgi:hypothetical protein